MAIRILAAFVLLAAAGCSDPGAEATAEPEPVTIDEVQAVAATKPELALAGDKLSLRYVDEEGDEGAVVIPFGQGRGEVVDAMGTAFGEPELARNEECGAGPIDFVGYEGITLNFQDDRFVGWSLKPGSEFTTLEGLAIGSPRGQVAALRGFEPILGNTIGDEFAVGGIYGLFGEDGVDTLWAGTNCIFR